MIQELTVRSQKEPQFYELITVEERRLLEALRSNPWGEATVVIKNGKPVMVKGFRQDVKLTDG